MGTRRWGRRAQAVLVGTLLWAAPLAVGSVQATASGTAGTGSGFELVGHDPLFARGMNAAPALYDDAATGRTFVYVGSRTDASADHPHSGILVVDTTDPTNPHVVGEITGPHEAKVGETSRELRVWPEAKLLVVLHFTCSSLIHACDPQADWVTGTPHNLTFYDLTDPANPVPVLVHEPAAVPHEIFLWDDPVNAGRALLYLSMPSSSTQQPNLVVLDISGVAASPRSQPVVLASWSANADIAAKDRREQDVRLHSMGVSPDGTRAYLAYLGGGFLVLDTSPLTNPDLAPPIALQLRTTPEDRPSWGSPGAHSAIELLGSRTVDGVERRYAITTDEVYGEAITPLQLGKGRHGCPWGWVRVIDITDETAPEVVGEYRTPANHVESCVTPSARAGDPTGDTVSYACDLLTAADPTATLAASYSAHNPTALHDLAFVTWHGAGLQAIDLRDPANPVQAGEFVPEPLPAVATEDPALSSGLTKVVMWSYPILNRQGDDTLIYVVDVRNGLYILRFTGELADRLDTVSFLEGNSNLGDALALDGFVPSDGPAPTGITFGTVADRTLHFDSPAPVGDVSRTAEFVALDDGPRMGTAAPPGPTKVQTFSRFGNPGLAANPLLSYFVYQDPLHIQGSPTLKLWLSAPGADGVVSVPVTAELFVDGTPRYGTADATGRWVPLVFEVAAGPVPTLVTITLPDLDAVALDSLVVQLGMGSATTDTNAKTAALLYGSPEHASALVVPAGFPTS